MAQSTPSDRARRTLPARLVASFFAGLRAFAVQHRRVAVAIVVIVAVAGTITVHDMTSHKVKRRVHQVVASKVFAHLVSKTASPASSAGTPRPTGTPASAGPKATTGSTATTGPAATSGTAPRPQTASSAATGGAPLTWSGSNTPLSFDGLARSYYIVVPDPMPKTPIPVVVALSGSSVTGQMESGRMVFKEVTPAAVIVYPDGYQKSWNAGHCCDIAQRDGINDVGFVKAVVANVLARYPQADPHRVYLAGYSNGAKLALLIACEASRPFAAVAVYGSTASSYCAHPPAEPIAFLASTGDPEVTIAGQAPVVVNGFTEPTVAQEAAAYRAADGCRPSAVASRSGTLSLTTWSACAPGERVEVGLYQGGTHAWPQSAGATPSAQAVMWQMFAPLSR